MEATLVLVTLISIAAAVCLSFMGWSLLRNDRRRSDARVAALEALALDGDDGKDGNDEGEAEDDVQADDAAASTLIHNVALEAAVPEAVAPAAVMFAAAHERRAPGRRWIAVAALMALGVGGAYEVSGPNARLSAAPNAARSVAPAVDRSATANHPLALLSLKHDADRDGAFVVTGLVQNPADGQPLNRVEALLYLFDDQGNYFAMGRAALEFTALEPGEQSPFVVRVPATTRVARYRVGFRLEGGGAVAHVDKRSALSAGITPESGS